MQNLETLFNETPLIKRYFPAILSFGLDTNILVMDPSLQCHECFEFNRLFNRYLSTFIHSASNQNESDVYHSTAVFEGKESFSGRDITRYLCYTYHTSIVNGFKVACESGKRNFYRTDC